VKGKPLMRKMISCLVRNRVAAFGNFESSSSGSATAGKYKHNRPRTRVLCISYEPPLRSLRRALVPPRICLLYPVTSFIHGSEETLSVSWRIQQGVVQKERLSLIFKAASLRYHGDIRDIIRDQREIVGKGVIYETRCAGAESICKVYKEGSLLISRVNEVGFQAERNGTAD